MTTAEIKRLEILHDIIYDLNGTTQDLEEVAREHGITELTTRDIQVIEDEIFLCAGCGWWCEVAECNDVDGDLLCDDCA